MTPALRLQGATWRYPTARTPTLGPVDSDVHAGELVLLTGPTGCGKSTLLRLAAGLAARHGEGEAGGEDPGVLGEDLAHTAPGERARRIGFVGQDPGDQLVTGTVGDELALAAAAAGRPSGPAELRAALGRVGLDLSLERPVHALSGGQRQRLVVAAALSAGARLLLLDEPLAWLDPPGAQDLLLDLRRLADAGVAVLLVEHRLTTVRPVVDRVLWMEGGRLVAEPAGPGARTPAPLPPLGPPVLTLTDLRGGWPGGPEVLRGAALTLHAGERVAVVGPNGAGKSTLLARIAGRIGPGRPGEEGGPREVPQDPDLALFGAKVAEELAYGLGEQGVATEERAARVAATARALGVEALLDRPPQALSRGQRLRVAVGATVILRPAVLLLDEPTAGQDRAQIERMFDGLPPDVAVLFTTHDLDLAATRAHRVLALVDGVLVPGLPPGFPPPPLDRHAPPPPPLPVLVEEPPDLGLDPRVRLGLLAALGVLAVVLERPGALVALTAVTVLAALRLRPSARAALQAGLGGLALVWATVLSQGLFYPEQPRVPLIELGGLVIWREGVRHGLVQSLRFLALALGGYSVAVSTPADRLLAGLLALRAPYGLAFLAATGLRFVPVIAEEWRVVRAARAARGRPAWRRPPWAWLRLEVELLRPVIARALRRARAVAETLDARGFDPARPPAARRPLQLRGRDVAVLGPALAAAGVALALRLLFVAYTLELFYQPELRALYGFVRAWM